MSYLNSITLVGLAHRLPLVEGCSTLGRVEGTVVGEETP